MNKFGVMDPRDPNSYKCCFCCHVKIGTILYGLFCLMVDICGLGLVVLLSIHPDILTPQPGQPGSGPQFDGIHLDEFHDFPQHPGSAPVYTKEDLCMAYAVTMVSIMTAVALLYGVVRNRPSYIIPFFCLHIFLFCLSCLTLVSYFTYAPHFNIKTWLQDSGMSNLPGMERVMEINGDYLMFFAITVLILILCAKAYLIGMMWACYKYVQQVVAARAMTREYHVDPDTEMLLPPRYEDAIKPEANIAQPPPPPYCQ